MLSMIEIQMFLRDMSKMWSNVLKSVEYIWLYKIYFFHKFGSSMKSVVMEELLLSDIFAHNHPAARILLRVLSSSSFWSMVALMSIFISKWLFLFWIVKLLSLTLLTWGNNREFLKRRYFLSGLIFVTKILFGTFFWNFFVEILIKIRINKETIEYS